MIVVESADEANLTTLVFSIVNVYCSAGAPIVVGFIDILVLLLIFE